MTAGVSHCRTRPEGIRFRARHGVSEAERYLLQDFVVDLRVVLPAELLPDSDERSRVFDQVQSVAEAPVIRGCPRGCPRISDTTPASSWPSLPAVRFISLSEYEAGFIAIGSRPFGVIALGVMPVGVVAVGVLPAGLLAIACGAGLGVVSLSCGVAIGAVARAVGLAVGGDAAAIGGKLALAGQRPEPEVPDRSTISAAEALDRVGSSWIEARVGSDAELGAQAVPVVLGDEARAQARRLRRQPVHALVRRREPRSPEAKGYREPADDGRPALWCERLADARPRPDLGARLWYLGRLAVVAVVVLAALGYPVRERLAITAMTRVAEVRWQARVVAAEGKSVAAGSPCEVLARLRTDGRQRLHAVLRVRCGGQPLFARHVRSGCTLQQRAAGGGYRYGLRCQVARVPRHRDTDDDDRPEKPGMDLDALLPSARTVVFAEGPPRLSVRLEVDTPSPPMAGPPLLIGGRERLEAR